MILISVAQLMAMGIKIHVKDTTAGFYHGGILVAHSGNSNGQFKLMQEGRYPNFGLLMSRKANTVTNIHHYKLDYLYLPQVGDRSNAQVVDRMPCLQQYDSKNHCAPYLCKKMTQSSIGKRVIN